MAIINLRDYYPFYTSDCFMEVSEEVAEMFKEFDRKEAAYRLRTYRHKAYYSLDRDDGLEHEAVFVSLSPHELYERKISMQELHAAISSLPDKQAKRIYAHFILRTFFYIPQNTGKTIFSYLLRNFLKISSHTPTNALIRLGYV